MSRLCQLAPLALGLILGLSSGVTRADLVGSVTGTVTPEAGGLYLYTYTVTDAATSTSTISELDLSLTSLPTMGVNTPVGAPISSITMPKGFINTYTPGDATVSFLSADPSTDIQIGSSGKFSFTSTFSPVLEPFLLSTLDGTGSTASGSVLTPASIPEPSSLILSGLCALGLLGRIAYARSRQVAA